MNQKKRRNTLAKWHSRLGVPGGIFVLLLTVTGVLINHSHHLSLDSKSVRNQTLLSWYGLKLPPVQAVQIENHWLASQGRDLYFDGEQLVECAGDFVGGITLPNYWVAACSRDMLVFSYEQELIEKVGGSAGLVYPIQQIGACEALLCYKAGGQIYQLDIETLEIKKFTGNEGRLLQWSAPEAPPRSVVEALRAQAHGGEITWERVLLDLHSGRFLGKLGPLVMDLIALSFLLIVFSGFYMWIFRGKNKSKSTRRS